MESFQFTSWPINIGGPEEGSLDEEQFVRLVEHLAAVTPGGFRGSCFAFYAALWTHDFDNPSAYKCELRELEHLYADDPSRGSPTNVWPTDRSWLVYTDYDLCGTKVSGTRELIGQLAADASLETVHLTA